MMLSPHADFISCFLTPPLIADVYFSAICHIYAIAMPFFLRHFTAIAYCLFIYLFLAF